ncbi:MAG: ATP-binding protein [Candidatus Nealsonbacteria bacterium]|nr:ATP-binding protein [Candidatus Nealsonbacteria bacterium]
MIKNIILQHKLEQEKFLSKEYITREKLNFAKKFLDKDLIKVITGPRRSGKSVFSILLLKRKEFAYLNFDDENLLKFKNYDEIVKTILEVYPKSKYVLFDEIQNLENWEFFVNKLQRRGYNLILTGSNAKLLSKELGTVLTGRYIPIEIFPFSFKEFLITKNFEIKKEYLEIPETKGKIFNYLDNYLKNGGFPEVVVKNLEAKDYLETLFDAILLKDVVKRYGVRFSQKIYDLAIYLVSNFSSEFSFTKLKNILNFRSVNTVQNYLRYLEEAYLVFSLDRFSFKTKEQIRSPRKIYLVDNGFILAKSFQFSQNIGKLMENLVLVEILRRGCELNKDIFYYKTRNERKIDFILKEGLKIKKLIQVCYDPNDLDTQKRELKSLVEASEELNCNDLLIITWDYEGDKWFKGKKIKFIPLWKWLISD